MLRWIYDIPGETGLPAADDTLDFALHHAPDALIGLRPRRPRDRRRRPQFKPHFDAARAAGLHSVPHAGETTGPQTVWDALRDLGAERIGHGTSSAQDPALLAYLAEHRIAARGLPVLQHRHPRRRRARGPPASARCTTPASTVTVNTDDPPMFGTTLNQEYAIAADLLDLDEAGLADLARAAVRASFAPDDVRGDC